MHPVVKILCFFFILLLVNLLSNPQLWILFFLTLTVAVKLNFSNFSCVIKRTKWLLISIFFIYAFTTPGEYIQQFPISFALTHEGLKLGLLQVAKLLITLATLSIFFATSSVELLMAGLYILLSPLRRIGFNVERFTARLLLTLDYVEELASKSKLTHKFGFNQFEVLYEATNINSIKEINLQLPVFNLVDKLVIGSLIFTTLALVVSRLFL